MSHLCPHFVQVFAAPASLPATENDWHGLEYVTKFARGKRSTLDISPKFLRSLSLI